MLTFDASIKGLAETSGTLNSSPSSASSASSSACVCAMATAVRTVAVLRNPNPSSDPHRGGALGLPSFSSPFFRLETAPCGRRRDAIRLPLARSWELRIRLSGWEHRRAERRLVPLFSAASREESHSDIEVEKEKNDNEAKAAESNEAWKESLEYFKAEALKVKAISEEAYDIYSKKAVEILMDTSEKLKIHADKAQNDLIIMMKEITEEGKEYISAAAKQSPDSVKDVVEMYASVDELKHLSSVRDFYLGIPYGSFLAIGGFLYFMLSGSIPAIRFGVILGSAILALSIASLRSWKSGKASPLLLKGQTAIASIIFWQWALCLKRGFFPSFLMFLISGAMVAFYVYRIVLDVRSKEADKEQTSEG